MISRRAALCVELIALLALGCKKAPPPTQVMVRVDAERAAAAEIAAVTIAVSGRPASGKQFGAAESERFEPARDEWPIEVAVVPEDNDASRRYRVVATALDDEDNVLSRVVAEDGYRKGEIWILPLRFDAACIARESPCPEHQTCAQGECVDVEEGVLKPLEPGKEEDAGGEGLGQQDSGIVGVGNDAGGSTTDDAGSDAAVVVEPCADDNGGCAPGMLCSSAGGAVECMTCPSGSLGSDGDCGPSLIDLQLSTGLLSPMFDPKTTEYTAELPLLVRRVDLVVTAPAGATLTIDEQAVTSGQAWTTPELPHAPRPFVVRVADAAGAARVYRVVLERTGSQVAYLKASNADVEDDFGRSVAVSGDTVVIGAIFEDSSAAGIDQSQSDNGAEDSGAVYVFDRDASGAFQQTAYIKPSDTREDGVFGSAVDLDGDTLLVGAIGGSARVQSGGAAYVFVREGGAWREQAKLEPDDGVANDWFGVAVALQGDTAIIAAPDRPTAAVYAYERTGDTWALAQRFSEDGARPGTRFGAAISLRGNRLLVGAPEDSAVATEGGAAYVFELSGGTWAQRHVLRPSSSSARDWFGFAISGNDDLIIVGTPYKNGAGLDSGAAYVFANDAGTWAQQQLLEPTSERAGTLFGSSLLLRRDGLLFVGAHGEFDGGRGIGSPPLPGDAAAPYSGGVYVYTSEAGSFVADSYVKAGNRGMDDAFGYVIDASEDLLVVGAMLESSDARSVDGEDNNGRRQSGAAYIFQ